MLTNYENHVHPDPDFPIIFHFDTIVHEYPAITHWHEGLEILYFTQGTGIVYSDMVQSLAQTGDLAVINSGNLHSIHALGALCEYYCLIIDKAFCDGFGIDIESIRFASIVQGREPAGCFEGIVKEMTQEAPYYKTAAKSHILSLLVCLCRTAVLSANQLPDSHAGNKIAMVKAAISYIRQHYREALSIDDICSHVGFSKYYFCRVFREITGKTVVDYINFSRCEHAQHLLSTGQYNVSQSAEISGIHNLSYFSKTYKKQIGISPSREERK